MENSLKLLKAEVSFILIQEDSVAYRNNSGVYNHSILCASESFLRIK